MGTPGFFIGPFSIERFSPISRMYHRSSFLSKSLKWMNNLFVQNTWTKYVSDTIKFLYVIFFYVVYQTRKYLESVSPLLLFFIVPVHYFSKPHPLVVIYSTRPFWRNCTRTYDILFLFSWYVSIPLFHNLCLLCRLYLWVTSTNPTTQVIHLSSNHPYFVKSMPTLSLRLITSPSL